MDCRLLKTKFDECWPSEFTSEYHVHILVREGEMRFSDGKTEFLSQKDDLVIWQMSNAIQGVTYSDDFEADFLVASGDFLARFNPEMVWASKGFIFIRINPSFHLHEESLRLMNDDFSLFQQRLDMPDSPFKEEIVGRVMQIFSTTYGRCTPRRCHRLKPMTMQQESSCVSFRWYSRTAASSVMWRIMQTSCASHQNIFRKSVALYRDFPLLNG